MLKAPLNFNRVTDQPSTSFCSYIALYSMCLQQNNSLDFWL